LPGRGGLGELKVCIALSTEVFDFFASTSSLWWYDRLPLELREKETEKTREYFQRKEIKSITSDVVLA